MLVCFSASCNSHKENKHVNTESKSISAAAKDNKKSYRETAYWRIPLSERIIEVNVGQGKVECQPPSDFIEFFDQLQSVDLSFAKSNNVRHNAERGHFGESQLAEIRKLIDGCDERIK